MLFNVLTLPVTMIPNLIYNDSGDSMFPHGEGFGQLWCGIPSLSARAICALSLLARAPVCLRALAECGRGLGALQGSPGERVRLLLRAAGDGWLRRHRVSTHTTPHHAISPNLD